MAGTDWKRYIVVRNATVCKCFSRPLVVLVAPLVCHHMSRHSTRSDSLDEESMASGLSSLQCQLLVPAAAALAMRWRRTFVFRRRNVTGRIAVLFVRSVPTLQSYVNTTLVLGAEVMCVSGSNSSIHYSRYNTLKVSV